MFSEGVVLVWIPLPVVVVNDNPRFGRIAIGIMSMLADVAAADDGCGRAHGRYRQQARTNRGACKDLARTLYLASFQFPLPGSQRGGLPFVPFRRLVAMNWNPDLHRLMPALRPKWSIKKVKSDSV